MSDQKTSRILTTLGAKRFRRFRWAAIAIIVITVVPYGFSRITSSQRCVTLHAVANSTLKPATTTRSDIRIACYNIAHGRGLAASNWDGGTLAERKSRLDKIAGLLREIDADVVVLNEVDFDSSWSSSLNQARYLAIHAGFPFWVEQRNLDFRVLGWKWRFGNAVLSKRRIDAAEVIDLPGFSQIESLLVGKKRSVSCTIDVMGQKIRVVGVHFSHRSEAIRAGSVDVVTRIVSSESLPVVIAGDFNSSPSGFPHSIADPSVGNAIDKIAASSLLQRRPQDAPVDESTLTFHSQQPTRVIDWVFASKDWQFVDYRVLASTLSDHRPVVADLRLTTE